MEGYIKLYRKILENKYWLEPRKKSKFEAWIYLLCRAGYKDKELVYGDLDLSLKAGEFVTSQFKLAEVLGWDRATVARFLGRLKTDNQISYKTSNKFTIITICNWAIYQNQNIISSATETPAESTTDSHQIHIKSSTNNKDNKEKKENNKDIATFFSYYLIKTKKNFRLTSDKVSLIDKRLKEGYTLDQLKQAVDSFVDDPWEGRAEHLDLIYCIGKQKGRPDNLEKWLNFKPESERLA
ncbi:MAG: hypothetical protein COX96_00605 [Candidatus Omnitrophica bacterium CG_4_10_14_0_2_um_filter_44_9]|nr:MAG: hypothetical protein COY78_03975 [Candidatus Omnitrophica bacterium CG_4_10_14_0_8_um_filter_44_12]PIZ85052.1 MAG: hypothetical protein COX96_00605 [Candidatus Omnitrophica bacterium CG_4_10_14_0_2_um_filter_44_9]